MRDDRFDMLYRKYGRIIYSRCRRLLQDPNAAEDATQEVFFRVARHLDKAPTSAEALMWIYRITTNHCLNELRNSRRRREPAAPPPPPALTQHAEDVALDRDLVRRLIERAPEALRAPAWLYHVDGMSHQEVGQALGCSRRTVINRVNEFQRRAREFLLGSSE